MVELSIVKIRFREKDIFILFDNYESTIFKKDGKIFTAISPTYFECLQMNIVGDICFFDYDNIVLENPIDSNDILNKWNFLMDIASAFGMYFEGNAKKHTKAYNYLFCCSTAINKTKNDKLPKYCIESLRKVFAKKYKLLNRLFKKDDI